MSEPYKRAIELYVADDKVADGSLTLQDLSVAKRFRRAAFRGGLVLIASIFCILIPLLHFIVVPLGLLLSFIIFSNVYRTDKVILHGDGKCPACGADFRILARKFSENFSDVCEKCQRQVKIMLKKP